MSFILDNLVLKYTVNQNMLKKMIMAIKNRFKKANVKQRFNPNKVFSISIQIKVPNCSTSIFIGYGSSFAATKNKVFVKINPSKASSELRRIMQYVHHFLSKKEGDYYVHSLDIAVDLEVPTDSLFVKTNKRKITKYLATTTYYGRRNTHGNLKIYNKKAELLTRNISISNKILTRIEYTYKQTNKITELQVQEEMKKNTFFNILLLDNKENDFFKEKITLPKNRINSKHRVILEQLKEKCRLPEEITNDKVAAMISLFIRDWKSLLLFKKKTNPFRALFSSYGLWQIGLIKCVFLAIPKRSQIALPLLL